MPKRKKTSKKRKKKPSSTFLGVLLISLFLVAVILQTQYNFFSLIGTNIPRFGWIPGLEGAKCTLDGVRFVNQFPTDWTGATTYHPITEGDGYTMVSHGAIGAGDNCYWMDASPSSTLIAWDYEAWGQVDRQVIRIESESHVQLENLDVHGDPLGWTQGTPITIRDSVQFQPLEDRNLEITKSGGETQYKLSKLSVLIVPATMHITFSFVPNQGNAGRHDSGWQEGEWYGCKFWFKLDFNTWKTISSPYAGADGLSEWDAEYWTENPASEYAHNKRIEFDDKGGFPLCGWIQGYYENVNDGWDDEIWKHLDAGSGSSVKYREDQSGVPTQLNAKTSTNPELTGRYLDLFTEADSTSSKTSELTGYEAIKGKARIFDWANAQVPAYFPIMVTALGTYTEGSIIHGWHIWYPAVNVELRVIWAVFGYFDYLWTVDTAHANEYPGWETRKAEDIIVGGPFDWLWQLLSNPIFLLFLFLFVVLIILVLLAIFVPGLLKLGGAVAERGAEYVRPRRPPPYYSRSYDYG